MYITTQIDPSIKKSDDINEPGYDLTRIHVKYRKLFLLYYFSHFYVKDDKKILQSTKGAFELAVDL